MLNLNQGQEFLAYFFIGMIFCFIFDIFRSSRYVFKPSDIVTHIEDTIFLIICFIIIAFSLLYISNGILRFFIVLAIFLGIITYSLTISRLCVIMFTYIFRLLEKYIWRIFLNHQFIK
jgi:spore cortex biosynthesis protein YabQ